MTVAGHARLVPQGFQLARELDLVLLEALVEIPHQRTRVHEDLAVVAVDDHRRLLHAVDRHVHRAHHRGYPEGVRENRPVGVA